MLRREFFTQRGEDILECKLCHLVARYEGTRHTFNTNALKHLVDRGVVVCTKLNLDSKKRVDDLFDREKAGGRGRQVRCRQGG